jgi:hypothetical protein
MNTSHDDWAAGREARGDFDRHPEREFPHDSALARYLAGAGHAERTDREPDRDAAPEPPPAEQ